MHEYGSLSPHDRDKIKAARLMELEQHIYLMELQAEELTALRAAHPADSDVDVALRATKSQLTALEIRLGAVAAMTNSPSTAGTERSQHQG